MMTSTACGPPPTVSFRRTPATGGGRPNRGGRSRWCGSALVLESLTGASASSSALTDRPDLPLGRETSAVAGVDDAESVPFSVSQHHGVSIGGVVPRHASCTKLHKPVDLGRLLGRAVDHEVEMDPRPLLDWCDRSVHCDACSDAVGWNQDREVVAGARERDDLVAQHVSPEGGGTIRVVSTQDDRPEA